MPPKRREWLAPWMALLTVLAVLAAGTRAPAQNLSDLGQTEQELEDQNPYRLVGTISGPQGPAEGVQITVTRPSGGIPQ